jgi:hypothetical protein
MRTAHVIQTFSEVREGFEHRHLLQVASGCQKYPSTRENGLFGFKREVGTTTGSASA